MSTIVEFAYYVSKSILSKFLPDKFYGVVFHYRAVFLVSILSVVAILLMGTGVMMALENLSFVSALYFASQTSVVCFFPGSEISL